MELACTWREIINMVDDLLLLSGNDIPFIQARVSIHQPTLKEIAYITEQRFWNGYEFLKLDKDSFDIKELEQLENISNFQLILSLLSDKNDSNTKKMKNNLLFFLSIIFPTSSINITQEKIILQNQQTKERGEINNNNFSIFLKILNDMFSLETDNKQYDPSGDLAKKIADKIKRGRRKKAQLEPKKQQKISFFSRYISILATAKQKSINEIMSYTVYQLMDEFNRYMLFKANEQWFSMKIAGATGLKDPQDWLKDIHSQGNKEQIQENVLY